RRAPQAAARHGEDADPTRPRAAARGREGEPMSHEPFDTLAAAWALGALDGEDRAAFERHLAEGCDVCAAELRSSAAALAAVARSVPPMIPPPEVKAALLGRINATAPTRRDAARPRRLVWAVASLVAVLAVAGFTATLVATRYESRLGQMAREAAARRALPGRRVGTWNAPHRTTGGWPAGQGLRGDPRARRRCAGADGSDGAGLGQVTRPVDHPRRRAAWRTATIVIASLTSSRSTMRTTSAKGNARTSMNSVGSAGRDAGRSPSAR